MNKYHQIANTNHVEDFRLTNGAMISDLSGRMLELKIWVNSKQAIAELLAQKSVYQQDAAKIKRELNVATLWYRPYFGGYLPTLEEQRALCKFQEEIADVVVVTLAGIDFAGFAQVLDEQTNTGKKPVATLADINIGLGRLQDVLNEIQKADPKFTLWQSRKLDNYARQYLTISEKMKELGIDYFLVGCRKRTDQKNVSTGNVDISSAAKLTFGFKACCAEYSPPRGGSKGFATSMDVLNSSTYEWEKVPNGNYRMQRLNNYEVQHTLEKNQVTLKGKHILQLVAHLRVLATK